LDVSEISFLRRVLLVVAVLILAALGWWLREILLLIFASVVLSIFIRTITAPVHKYFKLPQGVALVGVLVGLTVAAMLGLTFFGIRIAAQFAELATLIPKAFDTFMVWLRHVPLGAQIIDGLKQSGASSAIPALIHIPGYALTVFGAIADLLLIAAGGIYLSAQPDVYRRGFLRLVPMTQRDSAEETLASISISLRKWLLSQLAAMITVGLLVGIGLWAIGVPAAGALGLFAGAAEFVPIVGPIASAIPALLVSLLVGVGEAGWTLLVFIAIQQIEGNVLIPLLQQRVIAIPPLVSLFGLVGFATLFGPLGIVLATPLTIVILILADRHLPLVPNAAGV
jgi:predicted PurR-regulated permease PerM